MAHFASVRVALLTGCLIGFLSGCASLQEVVHKATEPTPAATPAASAGAAGTTRQAPVATPAAAAVAPATAAPSALPALAVAPAPAVVTVQAEFPTSKNKPQGKAWTVMKQEGFTGDFKVAGRLMGLTAKQAEVYSSMHSAGKFVTMQVPNGVVLDRLTFTRDGKHQVDIGAKVDLKDPPTRLVDVYDLGDGLIVMRFHGCNNHALVRGWNKPLTAPPSPLPAAAPAPTPTQRALVAPPGPVRACLDGRSLLAIVWQTAALEVPGVRAEIARTTGDETGFLEDSRLSRNFGPDFWRMYQEDKLKMATKPYSAELFIQKPNGAPVSFWTGEVKGDERVWLPDHFDQGDLIHLVYARGSTLASPVVSKRYGNARLIFAFSEWGKYCGLRGHAIEF